MINNNEDLIELNKSDHFKQLDNEYIELQRNKKNRYYSSKTRKKSHKKISDIIKELEETGKISDYISPKDIENRLVYIYNKIMRTNKYVFNSVNINQRRLDVINSYRDAMVVKFINLSSIIIGSLIVKINRNKSSDLSVELFDSAVLAILKLLKSGNYDSSKSKITS